MMRVRWTVPVQPLDRRPWSTVWWRGNADFLALVAAAVLVALVVTSCASTGSDMVDAAISAKSKGFFQRAWDFITDVGFPWLVGLTVFVLTQPAGDLFAAVFGTGATAATARGMRPDPPPTSINKTEIKVDAQPGSTVRVDGSTTTSAATAAQEPLMQTIEHYGFYILLAAFAWRNRRHLIAVLTGAAKGRVFRTLWHCLWGGDDPSTPNVVEPV